MKPSYIKPGPGQESVWDYPRPPKCEAFSGSIRIVHADIVIAESTRAYRVLETSHPPVYYLSPEDIKMEYIFSNPRTSFCEFKGRATYSDLKVKDTRVLQVAWSYPHPTSNFAVIKNMLAFYASKVDECYVNDEKVQSQEGDFYGGWITSNIVGPFKGAHGTWGW